MSQDTKRIERAAKKLRDCVDPMSLIVARGIARQVLEAADAEDPEIVVTEEMKSAGTQVYLSLRRDEKWSDYHAMQEIYRAMAPLAPPPTFSGKMSDVMHEAWNPKEGFRGSFETMFLAAWKAQGK